MTKTEIAAYLEANIDEKYQQFSRKLIPDTPDILGVRSPILRQLVREIKISDFRPFLASVPENHEQRMLYGMLLGECARDMELDELLDLIEEFVPHIDNWAVCDTLCSSLKIAAKNQEQFMPLIEKYLSSDREFELRFAVVMLMCHYIDQRYLDLVLEIYDSIRSSNYYVRMGVAWGLSNCVIHFPERAASFFETDTLDTWTHNKAIQKCRESFRVSDELKNELKKLKR